MKDQAKMNEDKEVEIKSEAEAPSPARSGALGNFREAYTRLKSRTWVEISAANLIHNLRLIKEILPQNSSLMIVVKGDAYGHGAAFVASQAEAEGADYFAVAVLGEAERLREVAIRKPILILSYTPYNEIESLLRNDITQTVSSYGEAASYSKEILRTPGDKNLKVHIKLDTGMARLGFSAREKDVDHTVREILELDKLPGIEVEGIFTHFAEAAEDEPYTRLQHERFMRVVGLLERQGLHFKYKHCANSVAVLKYPEMCENMVRVGIIAYGCRDCEDCRDELEFKPVMSYYARISAIREIEDGESVSYGRTYKAKGKRRIAVIEAGYSDGLLRSLSNRGYVKLHGKKAPIIGRICMDRSMIDISDIPEAGIWDTVCIFGGKGENFISADDQASNANTISYELFCDVNMRVPRIYVK